MLTIRDYILEKQMSASEYTKHNGEYLEKLILKLQDPNVAAISFGKQGEDIAEIKRDGEFQEVLDKMLKDVKEMRKDNIKEKDIEDFFNKYNEEISTHIDKPLLKIYKGEIRGESNIVTAADHDFFVAMALNDAMIKNGTNNKALSKYNKMSSKEKLRFVMNQDKPNKRQQVLLDYYEANEATFKTIGEQTYKNLNIGDNAEPFHKQKQLNRQETKTDIISGTGDTAIKLSIKKGPNYQLGTNKKDSLKQSISDVISRLDGDKKEEMIDLKNRLYPGGDEEKELWKDYNKVDDVLEEIWNDKKLSKEVFDEIVKGTGRFNDNSDGIPQRIVVIDMQNKSAQTEDIDEYVDKVTYLANKGKLSPKTANWSGGKENKKEDLRIRIKDHNKLFDKSNFPKGWKDEVWDDEKQETGTEEIEIKGKKQKVVWHRGPRGGKYYISGKSKIYFSKT